MKNKELLIWSFSFGIFVLFIQLVAILLGYVGYKVFGNNDNYLLMATLIFAASMIRTYIFDYFRFIKKNPSGYYEGFWEDYPTLEKSFEQLMHAVIIDSLFFCLSKDNNIKNPTRIYAGFFGTHAPPPERSAARNTKCIPSSENPQEYKALFVLVYFFGSLILSHLLIMMRNIMRYAMKLSPPAGVLKYT